MKRKFTLAFLALSLLVGQNKIQAQTTFASVSSGYWGQTAPYIWETFPSGTPVGAPNTGTPATGVPSGSNNIYVRSGHIVTTGTSITVPGANRNAFNITIESGASLSAGTTTTFNLRPGTGASGSMGNVAVITNNGTLGGPTDGTFVEVGVGATSLTFAGTGTTSLSRVRFVNGNLNPASALIFDQNVTLTVPDNYAFTATPTALSNADNLTATINTGKTVTITRGYWHNSGVSSGVAPNSGNYTYNINGILDMSATTAIGNNTFAGSTDATKTLTINLNGTVKLAVSGNAPLTISETAATGQQGAVNFNINNGGLLDAGLNTVTTSPSRYFKISGTGQLKRTAGSGVDVLFAVGTPSSYSPAIINNAGTQDNFSVNVKNTIDNTPPTANVVNKQWTINEDVAGGSSATIKLGWTTADQAGGFDPSSPVFIYRYNGSTWEPTSATVSGSGTTADPYVATSNSNSPITSFSPFIVGNSSILPVSFISNRAFSKDAGIQVEWSTAGESNISRYVVEASADGRTFSDKGTVAAANNRMSNSYSFYDATPVTGANFYRVKSVGFDGKVNYTTILRVNFGKGATELTISPNPVTGLQATLQLTSLPKGLYALRVYNVSGQSVYAEAIAHGGGSYTAPLQLAKSVKAGVYAVEVAGAGIHLKKMIVVQ